MNNNMEKRFVKIALGCILLIAVFFRFYKFPSVPPSLNWDEAAFGYNAYSVLKTGKDEFGKFLPVYFRSLDDYKLPVYAYLTVGSIAVFGYNDFSVRFPSAFFGVLTVLSLFFLVKGLCALGQNATINKQSTINNERIPLLSSFLLAILPWHIQFSRMAAEANVGLFFITLGATLFLYGMKHRPGLLLLSVLSFGLATYSYLSFRVLAPMLGLVLTLLYWKDLRKVNKNDLVRFIVAAGFFGTILIGDTLFYNVHIRVKGTSVFSTQQALDIYKQKEKEMFYDAKLGINLPRRLFHDNTVFTSADIVLKGYFTHFSPAFLFFDYDEKQHHTPFVGLCFLWMLPFIPLGLYYLVQKSDKREAIYIILWILIAPIPASITWDIPHAIRVLGMTIPLMIITAHGVFCVYDFLREKRIPVHIFMGIFGFVICLSSYYYVHQYILHIPYERSQDWVYGRKEMTEYLMKNKSSYDRIVVSSALEWPYIFMLYYSKYDPALYSKQGGTKSGGWGEEGNTYDIFEFHKFSLDDFSKKRTLFVGLPKEFSPTIDPLYRINYLDGTPAIYIAQGNIKTP